MRPELQELIDRTIKDIAELPALDRAIMFAKQKRSLVIGEMMLSRPGISREDAIRRYNAANSEGVLLDELERRLAEDANFPKLKVFL